MSVASALAKAKRLRSGKPPVVLLYNDPEVTRLGFDLSSERMALIEGELFEADENESTRAFHNRLVEIARSKNVMIVSVGSDEPVKVARFNLDGTPITLN